jgi:hypothetical protein
MALRLNGSSSGYVELDVPADAGSHTLTLPDGGGSSGQYLQTNGSGTLSWQTAEGLPDAIDVNASAPADSLNLDASGRVLVGTSTARTDLTSQLGTGTNGLVQIESTSNSAASNGLQIIGNSANGWGGLINLAHNGGSQGSNTLSGNNTIGGAINFLGNDGGGFHTAATIECRFDGAPASNSMPGKLSFFTTASGATSPTERMRISKNGEQQHFGTLATNINIANTATAGTTYEFLYCQHSSTGLASGTLSFRVTTNGNVQNTNNSYGAISDIKLKENIVDASSQWDDLKAIQVRNYNFKEETGHETHTQLGVIAQEIELVSPGLISESPDCDAEGNDLGTVTKSVNYSVLYMKAVKALQEAMERIETLETANASLEARLTALEGGAS